MMSAYAGLSPERHPYMCSNIHFMSKNATRPTFSFNNLSQEFSSPQTCCSLRFHSKDGFSQSRRGRLCQTTMTSHKVMDTRHSMPSL